MLPKPIIPAMASNPVSYTHLFKANTTDFFIKEQDIIGRNIFSYFPVETAREMYTEFIKVRAGDKPSARNYKLKMCIRDRCDVCKSPNSKAEKKDRTNSIRTKPP